MGYRTTFVSEHLYIPIPDWFLKKYQDSVHFYYDRPVEIYGGGEGKLTFPISSQYERKFYSGAEDELFLDIAKVLRETNETLIKDINIVLMHEDGEVDRVVIEPNKVTLQRSLKYDQEDDYNPQLGNSEEYIIPLDTL